MTEFIRSLSWREVWTFPRRQHVRFLSNLFVGEVYLVRVDVRLNRVRLRLADVQGLSAVGFASVVLTSRSVVIVVVPAGVEMVVSCLVDDLLCSLHPVMPIEATLAIRVAAMMRFIFNTFH